jgi:hydrogenase-4 membrane subunit HyfE
MSGVLIALAIVLVIPLFIATWRASLLGLSLQGAIMAWIVFHHGAHLSVESVIEFVDLVLVRTLAAPLLLYRVLRAKNAPPRNDVIAPNLLSWTIAFALVLLAFRVADALVPVEGDTQMLVAVAASALLLGLFVLATRTGPLAQIVGALRVENALALFELAIRPHHQALGLRLGQLALLVGTVGFFRFYLHALPHELAVTESRGNEGHNGGARQVP